MLILADKSHLGWGWEEEEQWKTNVSRSLKILRILNL